MKAAVALCTAGACCSAATVGGTTSTTIAAFLSTPYFGKRPFWRRSSAARLTGGPGGVSSSRGSPRVSVCSSVDGGLSSPTSGGRGGGGSGGRRGGKVHRSTLLSNLDLKPAYRLFDTVPPPAAQEAARKSDDVDLDVEGKAPYGKICKGSGQGLRETRAAEVER